MSKNLAHHFFLVHKKLVAVSKLTPSQIKDVRQAEALGEVRCPTCLQEMRLEITGQGPVAIHREDNSLTRHEVEDQIARQGKHILSALLSEMFPNAIVQLDVVFPEIGLLADLVVVNTMGGKLVIEYQRADLSAAEADERQQAYVQQGIECLWLLNARRLKMEKKTTGVKKVTLEKLETSLLANNNPVIYFNPQNKQIVWIHAPEKIVQLALLGEPRIGQVECLVRPYRLTQLRVREGQWWVDHRLEAKLNLPTDIPATLKRKLEERLSSLEQLP